MMARQLNNRHYQYNQLVGMLQLTFPAWQSGRREYGVVVRQILTHNNAEKRHSIKSCVALSRPCNMTLFYKSAVNCVIQWRAWAILRSGYYHLNFMTTITVQTHAVTQH